MNISDYLRTALLNHAFDVATFVPPPAVWAALYTVPPTSAGGGTEVTASDYVRVQTTWSLASLGSIQNSAVINFPNNGLTLSNWGVVNTLCLLDAPTTGNLLWFGPLSAPVQLQLGTSFELAIDGLTVTLS